jgi:hypothetical protein
MLILPPAARHRPGRAPPPVGAPAAVALTLVAAVCTEGPTLILTFDRPIDVSGLAAGLLRVDNGVLTFSYVGYATPTMVDPRTVEVLLNGIGDYYDPGVLLTAAAGNGIVAADDGGTWAGATDLSLPFGEG